MEQQQHQASEATHDVSSGSVPGPRREAHKTPDDIIHMMEKDTTLDVDALVPLPSPYESWKDTPIPTLSDEQRSRFEVGPDGVSALQIPKPATEEEKEEMVAQFLAGLAKLLDKENNWTFLQPLMLSLENCVKCQTCNDACGIYTDSGRAEMYRPTFRGEILRQHHRPAPQARGRHPPEAAGTRHRGQLEPAGEPGRAVVPLHAVPALRPDLPHRRGQRPHHPGDPEALQPGARHRDARAAQPWGRSSSSRPARRRA